MVKQLWGVSAEKVREHVRGGELTILSQNVRSINANLCKLQLLVSDLENPDVVCCQETWKPGDYLQYSICDYSQPYFATRKKARGGGVGIWCKLNLHHKCNTLYSNFNQGHFESIAVEVRTKRNRKYLIVNIYRPPGGDIDLFLRILKNLLREAGNEYNNNLILVGDININYDERDHFCVRYTEEIEKAGLHQYVRNATRVTLNTESIIDHIITRPLESYFIATIASSISDHLSIMFALNPSWNSYSIEEETPTVQHLSYKQEKINKIKEDLGYVNWFKLHNSMINDSADSICNKFCDVINNIIHGTALCNIKIKVRGNHPWYNRSLVSRKKLLNKLHKHFLRSKTNENQQVYQRAKTSYNHALREAKKEYYHGKLISCQNDSKETWRLLNEITDRKCRKGHQNISYLEVDGTEITDKKEIATRFNNFFSIAGSEVAGSLTTAYKKRLFCRSDKQFRFRPCTCTEIVKMIKSLKGKTSMGQDMLTSKMVKLLALELAIPLKLMFNKAIESGEFPKLWKTAKVIALHKKGEQSLIDNYRPISLLPIFSKVFEKILATQIVAYFEANNMFNKHQYGFRKGISTSHCLTNLVSAIQDSRSKKFSTSGVFFDLKKAFDIISHEILLQKLGRYGFDSKSLTLLNSYLSYRSQFVQVSQEKSSVVQLGRRGVPQGSVLGPLLFNVYINDINDGNDATIFLYADDTVLLTSTKNESELETQTQKNINLLNDWFLTNELVVNADKTKCMVFYKKYMKLNVKLNNAILEQIKDDKTIKYLGVELDTMLKFNSHTAQVCKKIRQANFALHRAKPFTNVAARKLIYNALIKPHFSYGCLVWGSLISRQNSKRLATLHNRAVKAIVAAPPRTHSEPIYKKLGILKFSDYCEVMNFKFVHDWLNRRLPVSLDNIFTTEMCNRARKAKQKIKCKYNGKLLSNILKPYLNLKTFHNYKFKNIKHAIGQHKLSNYYSICTVRGCKVCSHT